MGTSSHLFDNCIFRKKKRKKIAAEIRGVPSASTSTSLAESKEEIKVIKIYSMLGTREMPQQLRGLSALPENRGSILRIHTEAHNHW